MFQKLTMTQPPLIATFVSVSHNELLMYNLLSDLTKERVRRSDNLSCDSLNHCEDEGYFASVRGYFLPFLRDLLQAKLPRESLCPEGIGGLALRAGVSPISGER